jgi:hypothetical protein
MGGCELAGDVGDIWLVDVVEACGLDEAAGGAFVFGGKPAAPGIIGFAVGAEAGLRPDSLGVNGFGEVDNTGKFGKWAIGKDEVGPVRRMADALLDELIVAPFVEEEVVGIGATFDIDDETGVEEGFGYIAGGPVDEQEGVSVLKDFGGVHNGKVNAV